MSYSASVYSPSTTVTTLHAFPRYNMVTDFSLQEDYIYGAIGIFAITIGAGVILLLFQWIFFCVESCKHCCQNALRCENKGALRWTLTAAFIILLAGTGCTYFGRNEFQTGAAHVADRTSDLKDVFTSLSNYASSIQDSATTISTNAADLGTTCYSPSPTPSPFADLSTYSSSLADYAGSVVDMLSGIADNLDMVASLFRDQAPLYIDIGVGVVTGLIAIVVIFALISAAADCCCLQFFSIVISAIVLLIFCPLLGIETTMSIFLSDFCIGLKNGEGSMLKLANHYVPLASGLISFYTTCSGTDSLGDAVDDVTTAATDVQTEMGNVNSAISTCANSYPAATTYQNAITSALGDIINTDLPGIGGEIDCETINPIYAGLVHDVVCTSVIDGLYRLWVVHLACAFILWFLLFFIQVMGENQQEEREAAKDGGEVELTGDGKGVENI